MSSPHVVLLKSLTSMDPRWGEKDEDDGPATRLAYIDQNLALYFTQIARLREHVHTMLLLDKKPVLILDLDHTLIHAVRITDVSPDDRPRLLGDPSVSTFTLDGSDEWLVKLRPFVHTFLKEASQLFEMYIYTMATRNYALAIARILDPSGAYFDSKVISRHDSLLENEKTLDVVVAPPSLVVILDDTIDDVWYDDDWTGVVQMPKYCYFKPLQTELQLEDTEEEEEEKRRHLKRVQSRTKSTVVVAARDEREADGVLASMLDVLKRGHRMFFDLEAGGDDDDDDIAKRDVRVVGRRIREEVLKVQDCVQKVRDESMEGSQGDEGGVLDCLGRNRNTCCRVDERKDEEGPVGDGAPKVCSEAVVGRGNDVPVAQAAEEEFSPETDGTLSDYLSMRT